VAEILDIKELTIRNVRNVAGGDGEQHNLLVEHLVVLDVVQKRERGSLRVRGKENRRSLRHRQRVGVEVLEEVLKRQIRLLESPSEQLPATLPRGHQNKYNSRDQKREPPFDILIMLALKNAKSTHRSAAVTAPAEAMLQPQILRATR
jgi:hypothetical protein